MLFSPMPPEHRFKWVGGRDNKLFLQQADHMRDKIEYSKGPNKRTGPNNTVAEKTVNTPST